MYEWSMCRSVREYGDFDSEQLVADSQRSSFLPVKV